MTTVDSSFIAKELQSAEQLLEKLEGKRKQLLSKENRQEFGDENNDDEDNDYDDDNDAPVFGDASYSILKQLVRLQKKTDSLVLAQDYIEFLGRATASEGDDDGDDDDIEGRLFAQAQLVQDLALNILLKHSEHFLELCPALYEEAYLPLFHYVHEYLVTLLRQELQASRYPHSQGCSALLNQGPNGSLVKICNSLTQLETLHTQVMHAVEGVAADATGGKNNNTVLLELFHPILDRVHFHFGNSGGQNDSSNGLPRITTTRTERLPEWLLKYVRENILGTDPDDDGKPYQVIQMVDRNLAMPFGHELIRLIQWVLVDQRNFFNDPAIAGPQSNPHFLYSAMEQFLEFDATLKPMILRCAGHKSDENGIGGENVGNAPSFMGLMDVLVLPNSDLLDWWIHRERESVFATLFPDDDKGCSSDGVPKPLANHVSPRAEIFCALIRSVQYKAATLSAPGKYLREVAVPLCSQFVDALHETSVDLRKLLVQKQQQSIIVESQIVANIEEWIEIINGTELAARVLLTKERTWYYETGTGSSQSDHDLGRFGRSLQRLVEVMVEEFAATFVETILMERAKFASYLMLASHLLASQEWEAEDMVMDLSVELKDTQVVLLSFHRVCNSILRGQRYDDNRSTGPEDYAHDNIAYFAPSNMRTQVMSRVAEKFIEVALDMNHVTPDIWITGANVFARDVDSICGSCKDIPAVARILELTKLMTMNFKSLEGLFSALGVLVGSDTFLDSHAFACDARLLEEASGMLKAKNVNCSLEDAISILNRRRG